MQGTRLQNARLRGAKLTDGLFVRASFLGAWLSDAQLDRANLTLVSFVLADLTGASLRFAGLDRADFSGANIQGTVFAHANVSEALNLDAARNANAAIWDDQSAVDSKP